MGGLSTLVAPQSTPDGEGDRYMTTAEMGAILDAANVRATPEVHDVQQPLSARRSTAIALLLGLRATTILGITVAVFVRRPRAE